jgi:transposase-like protein
VTDFLDQKVQEIHDRLRELEPLLDEYERLRAAMDALEAVGSRPAPADAAQPARPARRRTSGGGARRGRPRAGEPTRADGLVELAKARPGITIAQAAKEMDVAPNGLYQVVAKLTKDGVLRKQGPGLFALGAQADTGAPAEAPAEEPAQEQAAEPQSDGQQQAEARSDDGAPVDEAA